MVNMRLDDLKRFYDLIARLERRIGGARALSSCSGRSFWPSRGIYFFREHGEERIDTGSGPRIVRVGTHALKEGSATTLWNRLSQHKGQAGSGGGNHRGSIFRLTIGTSLIKRDSLSCSTWGQGSSAPSEIRKCEQTLERVVSEIICRMPFLYLAIEDEPGPDSRRGYIERNSIALLSNFGKTPIDPPSQNWLGLYCNRERVRASGLWNSNHVDDAYDPAFLDAMNQYIERTTKP